MNILLAIEAPKHKFAYLTKLQPLGILYIASYLESKGINTDVADFNVQSKKSIDFFKYDLIGFSVTSGNIENTLQSAEVIKSNNPKIKVILGGPLISLIPQKLIKNPYVDLLIEGESEDIIYDYIKKGINTKGIWVLKDKKPYYTGKRKPLENLDTLPFPSLEKVPYRKYNVVIKKRSPVAGIITSRGCPYTCIFCHHSLGFKYRARSPENVIEEIKRNISLGIKELWIADDNFSQDMKRVEKICDLIISNKLDITFTLANGVRADRLNERLLRKFKKAGIWFLTIAPESGNHESLKKMHKGFNLKDAVRVSRLCKKLGIRTMSNFILGFPWETEKHIIKTIEFAKYLDTDLTHFSRMIPYPSTPLWEMITKKEYEIKDEAHNYGGLRYENMNITKEQFDKLIKMAYRETMFSPKKILNLSIMLRPLDIFSLINYALATRSV